MATSEERRLAVYGALVARHAGHLSMAPVTDYERAQYDDVMRKAVQIADVLSEAAEIEYLRMKSAQALVEPAPTPRPYIIMRNGGVTMSEDIYDQLVKDAEVVRGGHWDEVIAERDGAEARVKELEEELRKAKEALPVPAEILNTFDVQERIKRVIELELVKIAEELVNPRQMLVTVDAEDLNRVDVSWPVTFIDPPPEMPVTTAYVMQVSEAGRALAMGKIHGLAGHEVPFDDAGFDPAPEDTDLAALMTKEYVDKVDAAAKAAFDASFIGLRKDPDKRDDLVLMGCTLSLKLLDGNDICGKCGYPAKLHRNWEPSR